MSSLEKKNRKTNKTVNRNITTILSLGAVLILFFCTVAFWGTRAFNKAIIEINFAHINELAEHDAKFIENTLVQRLNILEEIAENIAYWAKMGLPVSDLLHSNELFSDPADKIAFVSKDGTVYESNSLIKSQPDIASICMAHEGRFARRFDNKSPLVPEVKKEYIIYGVPIKPLTVEDHTYEYLCCFIKPGLIDSELKLESYGGRGYSSVIDNEGNYILNMNRSHSFLSRDNFFHDYTEFKSYSSVKELYDSFETNATRATIADKNGSLSEVYVVFTPLSNDWYLISTIPEKVFAEQTRNIMAIAIALIAIVGVSLGIVILFAIRFSRQREELKNKAVTEELNRQLSENQAALEKALGLAQSANRAKTTFLKNMSHDIRTPMNAIIGYTGLASSHIDNKEQVQNYLSKIGQSSQHLLSLINDVLDMSRIESGKMNLDEKEEDLAAILHTLRNIVQADIHNKQIDFFMDCDVNSQYVICDKLRLNQVLLNIVSNSIKYTPAGGTISVRLKQIGITESGYGKYEFSIKDNGMGMSQEFLKTIFEPFTRVNNSTISGIQGTGLGMAITKNIVDMMGGKIEIQSEEGKGTETTISFEFKLTGEKQEPVRIAKLEGLRSLVVDDDMNTCKNVSKMLREAGMRSQWCASGKEAVIRTEEAIEIGDLFRVYIIDWLMPDMNGIETARRIRKIVPDDAPIIVLTAYDWSDIEEEAKEAGVTAFVSKPLFPSDLYEVLNKCCGNDLTGAESETKEPVFEGKKILLVEDNEMNREIAAEILEEDGFIIDAVEDGSIAVERMKTAKPGQYDLILMDVQMPIMNGYDATRAIRTLPDPEIANITIIAMTANAFEEDRQEALRAGMNEHIAKPINVSHLKQTLAKFIK